LEGNSRSQEYLATEVDCEGEVCGEVYGSPFLPIEFAAKYLLVGLDAVLAALLNIFNF
jgi:hypothetical protein